MAPRCEKCNKKLAEALEGRLIVRCTNKRCYHLNIIVSETPKVAYLTQSALT